MITIARFDNPVTANIAKARLDAAGIPALLADEHTVSMNWLLSNAIGGVRLQVPDEYAVRAMDLLEEDLSDEVPDSGIDDGSPD